MLAKASKRIRKRLPLGAAAPLLLGLTVLAIVLMMGGYQKVAASDLVPLGSPSNQGGPAQPAAAPAAASVTIDLYATTGSVTMPDGTPPIPIWGFTETAPGLPGTAKLPGPNLVVDEGDDVTVVLHNKLSESVSIVFPGQTLVSGAPPDTVGVAPGGTKSYNFIADAPGTYLYEAGTNTQVQLPMGLYGALIVRSATLGQAYDDPATAFDQEELLLLSEIDPALNSTPDPNTFDITTYDPKYWLINGKAYPDTEEIFALPDSRVLLRYANAGLINHTMQIIGMHQEVIAGDAYPLSFSHEVVSQTIASGQTYDMIVTMPAAAGGSKFPLYSANQYVTNVDTFPGGMLTFLSIFTPAPLVANPCVGPNPLSGVSVTIDLWATEGTVTMPDGTPPIPIWGFTDLDPLLGGTAELPGPTLDIAPGDDVTVVLHNDLSEYVSIVFPGQTLVSGVPDTVGVAPGGTKSYNFLATAPGTYLYEAGTNTQVQLPMGLYGGLIVRSTTPGEAYNCPESAFDEEALLVLSEIDPALNSTLDPNTFDMTTYDPKYWLINGKAYPDTAPIFADPGDRLLFRYANAGIINHTLQIMGMHQEVFAGDAYPLLYRHEVVSHTVASGQTSDLIGTLPLGTPPGTKYALYSANQYVTNVDDFPGGMLMFVIDAPLGVSANCVSTATMTDALLIARYVVGLRDSLPCMKNADVNRDDRISMIDALTTARWVIGLSN